MKTSRTFSCRSFELVRRIGTRQAPKVEAAGWVEALRVVPDVEPGLAKGLQVLVGSEQRERVSRQHLADPDRGCSGVRDLSDNCAAAAGGSVDHGHSAELGKVSVPHVAAELINPCVKGDERFHDASATRNQVIGESLAACPAARAHPWHM